LVVRRLVLHHLSFPEEKPWGNVLLTLPSLLWFYVRELFWPANLSVFHDTPLVAHPGLKNFLLPLLGVLAAGAAGVYVSRRSKIATFGCWWLAVLMLPPILGIYAFIPEDLVHDRYLYLPTVGLAIVCAWAIRTIPSSGRRLFGAPGAQMTVTLALGLMMAASTALQTVYWTNDLILYAHAVQMAPNNVIAINHLANEFYKRRDVPKAMALYKRSLQVKPHWATHFALGITLYELGDLRQAQQHLEEAIPMLPDNDDEYYYLGLVHMGQGHYAEAEPCFRKAMSLFVKPGYHWALAMSLEKQGKMEAARDELNAELRLNPTSPVKAELERVEKANGH
jgi:Flp pilus assembly protein TadD